MKNFLLSLVLAVAVLVPMTASAQSTYVSSTISAAIDAKVSTFTVGSNTGLAPANGANSITATNLTKQVLVLGNEAMEVQSVTGTTRITVIRGYAGTQATSHKVSERFYAGDPSWFKQGDLFGACSETAQPVLPIFSTNRNTKQVNLYNCVSGNWQKQTLPGDVYVSGAYTTCNYGAGNVLASVGISSSVAANTTENVSELFVPYSFYATGASIISGTAPDSGTTRVLDLRSASGRLLANTLLAGTASTGTASIVQQIAFTGAVLVSGPATYLVGYSASGSDANGIELFTTQAPNNGVTGQITSLTYGTVPASITPPTSFNTATGAPSCLY